MKESRSGALRFANERKDAAITLTRNGDATGIRLIVRDVALARSEGLLPEPGKGRLVLANAHNVQVVFTIGKTDYKLKPGQGAENPKNGAQLLDRARRLHDRSQDPGSESEDGKGRNRRRRNVGHDRHAHRRLHANADVLI